MTLSSSPFHSSHEERGASFTDFGGWTMPVTFDSIREEHEAVRSTAGIFDVSHMGEIELSGPDATDLLQRLTTNDVESLDPGGAQYAAITDQEGVMLDDTVIYRPPTEGISGVPGEEADYLFIPNAGHDAEMHERFTAYRDRWDFDADVENVTDSYGMLAVQGPDAEDVVADAADSSLRGVGRFRSTYETIEDVPCLFARTGYTGEDGFEILVPAAGTRAIWEAFECQPCGLGARDTLRLEMGYLLSGQDFDPQDTPRTPFEAGIDFAVDLDTDFVGRDALASQREAGLEQEFVGFELTERGVPRHGYPIRARDGTEIGTVTSGTMSPSLDIPIGLGYVETEYAFEDTAVRVAIRGESKEGIIVGPPFLDEYR